MALLLPESNSTWAKDHIAGVSPALSAETFCCFRPAQSMKSGNWPPRNATTSITWPYQQRCSGLEVAARRNAHFTCMGRSGQSFWSSPFLRSLYGRPRETHGHDHGQAERPPLIGDHIGFIAIEWTTPANDHTSRMVYTDRVPITSFSTAITCTPAKGESFEVGHGIVSAATNPRGHQLVFERPQLHRPQRILHRRDHNWRRSQRRTVRDLQDLQQLSQDILLPAAAAPENNPTDVEIRHNHLFRPMIWKEGDPACAPSPKGEPYIVKNNLELKAGCVF